MSRRVLYTVGDSPPGRAVQMALQYLDLNYEVQQVDFDNGEHLSENFRKGEIPVLDDFGFIVGESVAILQYLAVKYPRDDHFYPKDPEKQAIVHHRLAFHLSTYYRRVHDYMILPMDYAYERTKDNKKKLNYALKIFDEILRRQKTNYVAGDKISIADLLLIMGTVALNAMDYDFSPFPHVLKWYKNFQTSQPMLWPIAQKGLEGLTYYNKHPRDMSHLKHPIHPTGSVSSGNSPGTGSPSPCSDQAEVDGSTNSNSL